MPQAPCSGKPRPNEPRQNRAGFDLSCGVVHVCEKIVLMFSHFQIAARLARRMALACPGILLMAGFAYGAEAAGCLFEPQGDGLVADVIDARSFRLDDGREVRLAGIEPVAAEHANDTAALASIIGGREVTLRGPDDMPDRYGRQSAFVFLAGSERSVQSLLLTQGAALVSGAIANQDCAALLTAAEAVARQAGYVTYLNFGRNWTRGFAVTIPKRVMSSFVVAGIVVNSLERCRIRVRGFVEAQRGPRIEVLQVGQMELLSGN
jgi:endonuclease YncB( thermonuclease family)